MIDEPSKLEVDVSHLSSGELKTFNALLSTYNYGILLLIDEEEFKNEAVENIYLNSRAFLPQYVEKENKQSYNQVWDDLEGGEE